MALLVTVAAVFMEAAAAVKAPVKAALVKSETGRKSIWALGAGTDSGLMHVAHQAVNIG
jgi:hypothetical protein